MNSVNFSNNRLYVTHPRTKAKIEKRKMKLASNIHLIKPLGFLTMLNFRKTHE